MKTLFEYLLSKNSKQTKKASKLDSWEACSGTQYIPADIMHQHIIDALDINWLKPEDVLKDFEIKIGDKESAAKTNAAYADHKLEHYSKFEDTLKEIIENSAYANKTEEILSTLYDNYLPIFEEIINQYENK
jgi:hypothetical protein